MKCLLFTLASLLLIQTALAVDLKAPTKCEEVLPANTCTNLRAFAAKFHEKVGTVNQAIVDAIKQHKTKVSEILAYVKEYIVEKGVNFGCSDLLNAETCQKIKDFATAAHIQLKEVNRAVREAFVNGAVNVNDIYKNAIAFLTTEVTCEKVLGVEACTALRIAASKFHENVQIINQAIAEALEHHLNNANEILMYVREIVVEKAINFQCTDALSVEQCAKIDSIGQHLKLKTSEINLAIKEAMVSGAEQAKAIYGRALGFLMNDVKNLKCEDLIKAETCTKINDYAKKLHLSAKDTAQAVKEAIIEGSNNVNDLFVKAKEYLKAQLSCDKTFSVETCKKIQSVADKFGVSLATVNDFVREAIANGISSATDLYKQAAKFITDKWTDSIFGDEVMFKRSLDHEELKAKVNEAIEMLMGDAMIDENM